MGLSIKNSNERNTPGKLELEILEALNNGNVIELLANHLEYRAKVKGFCRKISVSSVVQSEDLEQLFFLSLIEGRLESFDPAKGKLSNWTYRVLANLHIDLFRRYEREQKALKKGNWVSTPDSHSLDNPMQRSILKEVYKSLPPREKQIVDLFCEGKRYEDIARLLGMVTKKGEPKISEISNIISKTRNKFFDAMGGSKTTLDER